MNIFMDNMNTFALLIPLVDVATKSLLDIIQILNSTQANN